VAHNVCWLLAVEQKDGMDIVIELDNENWRNFTIIEIRRKKGWRISPAAIFGLILN
jgi:hypothetical protein